MDIPALIHADRWPEAMDAARLNPDPVAQKLVTFYRLLAPHAATVSEIDAFLAANPDWPLRAVLLKRRDEALAAVPPDGLPPVCDAVRPHLPDALEQCGDAYAAAGRGADAAAAYREAWIALPADPAMENAFLNRHGAAIGAADLWQRFDALCWRDPDTAARELSRLAPTQRPEAMARLALRHDAPNADTLVATLPPDAQSDPAMLLDKARWLRRASRAADAQALWAGPLGQVAPPEQHRAAFWVERNLLARQRLHDGDAEGAYHLVAQHGPLSIDQTADAEFLAGWIALRRLQSPARAVPHFQALADLSRALITQSRAHYWLGRAAIAAGDTGQARTEYALAAAWPTTYYGQLAALALGDPTATLSRRIRSLRDPQVDQARALGFAGRELTRAAAILVAWNETHRARLFLARLEDITPDPADKALAARLATGFGLPDQAVAMARLAGRDGVLLVNSGWPMPYQPPAGDVEAAYALGVMRQESSFDAGAISPAGARGLMQLMPKTAQVIARQIAAPADIAALTTDPGYNMQLGTVYLRQMLGQFGNSLPLAAAGYNAGPNRVREWLATNGDPAGGQVDMIDWIELIPFAETRNYVQRVVENVVIYRALRGDSAPHPLLAWAK